VTEPDADDTEAAWREIVENYGDRAVVDPEDYADRVIHLPPPSEPGQPDRPHLEESLEDHFEEEYDELEDDLDDEDRFVPPEPEPLPHTRPDRLVAWIGVLGAPAVVLVLLLTGLSVDPVIGWLLVAAFVGGFGYLVATMSREPRDPWDDGSRV
jgi:hypothetical protein